MEDGLANMAYELVKAAYLILPEYEYCILTVTPAIQEHALWKYFTLVPPKPNLSPCVLYISNRFSESGTVVRKATETDILDISSFLKFSRASMQTYNDFEHCLKDSDNILAKKSFVIEISGQIVGVALLGQCLNSRQVVDQFDVAKFINSSREELDGKYLYLLTFVINPLFESQSRFVFRVISKTNLLETYAASPS
jgi:hypothetical protein